MEHKAEAMTKFFQEQIARCEADRQALLRDDRGDEATFQRIRGNIFDIFQTVLSVAVQNCNGDEAIGAFFSLRLEQIPGSWLQSLEAAGNVTTPKRFVWNSSSWRLLNRSGMHSDPFGR